jgi:hypothetical protein
MENYWTADSEWSLKISGLVQIAVHMFVCLLNALYMSCTAMNEIAKVENNGYVVSTENTAE